MMAFISILLCLGAIGSAWAGATKKIAEDLLDDGTKKKKKTNNKQKGRRS